MADVSLRDAAQALLDALPTIWQGSDEGRALRAALAAADTAPGPRFVAAAQGLLDVLPSDDWALDGPAAELREMVAAAPRPALDAVVAKVDRGRVVMYCDPDGEVPDDLVGARVLVYPTAAADGTTPAQPDEVLWEGPVGQLAAALLGKKPSARGWDPDGIVRVVAWPVDTSNAEAYEHWRSQQ